MKGDKKSGKGTANQIFTLIQTLLDCYEYNIPTRNRRDLEQIPGQLILKAEEPGIELSSGKITYIEDI